MGIFYAFQGIQSGFPVFSVLQFVVEFEGRLRGPTTLGRVSRRFSIDFCGF